MGSETFLLPLPVVLVVVVVEACLANGHDFFVARNPFQCLNINIFRLFGHRVYARGNRYLWMVLYLFEHVRIFVHIDGYAQHVLNAGIETALDQYVEVIFEFIKFNAIEMTV
jgi:hypothetical protein